ncbi:MFS multidrug transporter-like protein [Hortaea werneckii]|nr:MFS multidrug transporter-like protein [Hortaea werneckii]
MLSHRPNRFAQDVPVVIPEVRGAGRDHKPGYYHSEDDFEDNTTDAPSKDINPSKSAKDDGVRDQVANHPGSAPFDVDIEAQARSSEESSSNRPEKEKKDPNLVTWDGPDDPENPKNWSTKRKWAATLVVSSFTFISPVVSSMVAPSLDAMSADLGVRDQVESEMMLSIFILAYAFGPLFLGPISELVGRRKVLQLGNAFFFAFNLGGGFAQTETQMMVCRFFAGLGGSAPLSIGGGVLGDSWQAHERGRAIAVYSLMPLIGPAIGPIAGGFITENTTWRWAFWSTSAACGLIQGFGWFYLQETYAPEILRQKKVALIKATGNKELHTEFESPDHSIPIIQVLAIYLAYVYGLMYLVVATFPLLWTSPEYYNESVGIGGLNYISLAVGFFIGSQTAAPLNDRFYRQLKQRNGEVGKPEFRIPLMVPGSFIMPVGLFWYGWTAQTHQHWILPNIGAAIFAAGGIVIFQCIQTYLIDGYTRFAASALAAAVFLRSLCGFAFPLFAPYMYDALKFGWGNSLLGFIAIGIGIPAPFLLWKYGPSLRAKSQYAAGGG